MNIKKKWIRYLFRGLALLWMIFIFSMSARNAELSTEDSNTVGRWIAQITVPSFDEMSETEQQVYIDALDHGIRKTAHAAEYAILAIFISLCFEATTILRPWLLTTFYAMTDECHQLFVPGRSGQIGDVCIDSAGALGGVILLLICFKWIQKYKEKNKSENVEK